MSVVERHFAICNRCGLETRAEVHNDTGRVVVPAKWSTMSTNSNKRLVPFGNKDLCEHCTDLFNEFMEGREIPSLKSERIQNLAPGE